jgi:hypothetical protein
MPLDKERRISREISLTKEEQKVAGIYRKIGSLLFDLRQVKDIKEIEFHDLIYELCGKEVNKYASFIWDGYTDRIIETGEVPDIDE